MKKKVSQAEVEAAAGAGAAAAGAAAKRAEEEQNAKAETEAILLTADDKVVAAVVAAERQGLSKFVGVSWDQRFRKWKATIRHDGTRQHLGCFDDEHAAARAVDTAARRLRGNDAHSSRSVDGDQ
jgi:hypothetical protein